VFAYYKEVGTDWEKGYPSTLLSSTSRRPAGILQNGLEKLLPPLVTGWYQFSLISWGEVLQRLVRRRLDPFDILISINTVVCRNQRECGILPPMYDNGSLQKMDASTAMAIS